VMAAGPATGRHHPGGLAAGQASRLADRLARAGVQCAQVPVRMATPAFVARAHALGLQVHVWTVNERPVMHSMLDHGVDGIMTDQTVTLREVLSGRGQWYPRVPG
jgi:glycerophosphoryl diester phosphodiesterase